MSRTYKEIDECIETQIKKDGFLKSKQARHWIDKKFGYRFEGKREDDHLLADTTWKKYLDDFYQFYKDDTQLVEKYYSLERGGNRNREYHITFIKALVKFKKKAIIELLNSNRKSIVNPSLLNFAKIMNIEFSEGWVEKDKFLKRGRVLKTEYEMRQEGLSGPEITEEDIQKRIQEFKDILINELVDLQKLKEDAFSSLVNNDNIVHGLAIPFQIVEDESGYLSPTIDWTNYLKKSVIEKIRAK